MLNRFHDCLERTILIVILPLLLTPGSLVGAQSPAHERSQTNSEAKTAESKAKSSEADLVEAQRRAFAISIVMSLADEARSYRDLAFRARVLARAADMLWDADSDAARTQFRRAWEAAEKADAEEVTTPQTKDGPPVMLIALRKIGDGDLRSEVLTLAARRDRQLGEEFLAKLTAQINRDATDATGGASTPRTNDSGANSQPAYKQLLLARRLLDEDQIERALEFATPVLNEVNEMTISFLSALRAKKPQLADQRFVLLLVRAELDPLSDANTVSGLSTYAFTPGLYVTFSANGSISWSAAAEPIAAPNLSAIVRSRFFQVASSILLRPLPARDQDFTSAGRTGKYMVIKRLLPLFDLNAPNTAAALRAWLASLTGEQLLSVVDDDDFLMTQGIKSEVTLGDALANMQERLDHAKTSRERDAIYEDAAAVLAGKGDARAQDIADKIDNSELRALVRGYVDLSLVQFAIRKKDASSAAGLAKAGQLSHTQRSWAYTQAARLLMSSQRSRALDLLEEALAEARRTETDDPNRTRMLIGVATQFLTADRLRAWEIMGEAVRAANAVEEFSGEDAGLNFVLATASGLKFIEISGSEFSLARVMRLLTKEDLIRANDLARGFKNDAPRAVATLAIASSVFRT